MISELIKEVNNISLSHKLGDALINADAFSGEYREAALAINNLLSEMRDEKKKIAIAEENSEAKSRFLARMSHEIRTPIATVLGVAEIQLKKSNHPLPTEEAFAKIHSSANTLLGIVNDILDLSRIEAGKMSIIEDKYELASIIIDVAQLQLVYIGNKNIEFQIKADENLPAFLYGDGLRIKQIMNNLLSNAFKYTENGTVELELTRAEGDQSDFITLNISIKDTGRGMTKGQLAALSSSEYSRFHEREDRATIGTGLGMPIVFHLAEMMGASVEIESEPDVGTLVTVKIPQLVSGSKVLGPEFVNNLIHSEILFHSTKTKIVPTPMPYGKVLVVDDIEANLYVVEGYLRFYQISTETCDSGFSAIEKIQSGNKYDIVFMDHMMPQLDGMKTTKLLREMGYTEPIVALTANALIGQSEEFLRNGFDGFVSKPIQAERLDSVLRKFILDKQPIEVRQSQPPRQPNISNYMNDPEILERVRKDFIKSHKDIMPDIRAAVQAGDFITAHRLAHNLKGLAGLIKEDALANAAAIIEGQFRKGAVSPYDITLVESGLESALERVTQMERIENAPVAEPEPLKELTEEMKERAKELTAEFESLLEDRNVDCLDLLDGIRVLPGTELLVEQVDDFDFKLALGTLHEWRDKWLN